MAVVRWTQKAANDLEDIGNYIEKDSKKYASIVVKRIYSSALILTDFPEIGRIVPEFNNESIRELIEGKYRIVYRRDKSDIVEIITIHHSARPLDRI
jgi:addiction module RelE/StbE family toxin